MISPLSSLFSFFFPVPSSLKVLKAPNRIVASPASSSFFSVFFFFLVISMSLLRWTHPRFGLRPTQASKDSSCSMKRNSIVAVPSSSMRRTTAKQQGQRQKLAASRSTNSLTSSNQLWESAVHAFYAAYARYTANNATATAANMTRAAEQAMRRCLAERRAAEALEVYETLCRCGVVGMATSSPSRNASAQSLDELAQEALLHVPHRTCQYAMLSLLMAAEFDTAASASRLFYPADEEEAKPAVLSSPNASDAAQGPGARNTTAPFPAVFFAGAANVSAAEQARIRVHQRLHTLHTTGQLPQMLGKEYCLVEMQELCADSTAAAATSLSPQRRQRPHPQPRLPLRQEIEVDPLCALSRCVLEHPFAYVTPSAPWAQQELLWEADMWSDQFGRYDFASHFPSAATTATAAARATDALAPADVARLKVIDSVVSPYRSLCKNTLSFLATFVPNWDAVLVRRVAETLVLPPEAHALFPAKYHRSRKANATGASPSSRSNAAREEKIKGVSGVATHTGKSTITSATAWTDASAHQLFGCDDTARCSFSSMSPMVRVEAIVKRRVHHDVVVPDTAYLLHRFHQLRQLARHREVIVTHAVFLELVAAASRTGSPLVFHARRVLRDVMYATTTAVTAAATAEMGGGVVTTAGVRKQQQQRQQQREATCGFTLLGLQDELALLARCPERFFLQEHLDTAELAGGSDGRTAGLLNNSTSCRVASSVSAVLVAKQLERVIAAHDRGKDFATVEAIAGDTEPGDKTLVHTSVDAAPLDVDGLVSHLLNGNEDEAVRHQACSSARRREEPLFKSRSRGHWARLPTLVATMNDSTRSAAFQVGLSMYPPAGIAP